MKSWLLGMMHAHHGRNPDFADYDVSFLDESLPFDAAVEWAQGRVTLTPAHYRRLSDHMKLRAFTVGRLTQLDMVEKARRIYQKQLSGQNASMTDFVKTLQADADGVGYAGYYEMVYRTNIQTDYNAGRAMEMANNQPVALEFIGIEDSRQSDICASRSGVILPYNDPWWENNWPPLHYNCRSTVRAIYREEAESTGLMGKLKSVSSDSLKVVAHAEKPQGSFGKNPARNNQFWKVTASERFRINKALIDEELNGIVGQTICKDFDRIIPGYQNVPVAKGGVRYPDALPQDELKNIEIAKTLVEDKGYFIELRPNEALQGNVQYDGWLNGLERIEIKDFVTAKRSTMSGELAKAAEQAPNVAVRIHHRGQIDDLIRALGTRVPELKKGGRTISMLGVIFDGKIRYLTWDDLQDVGSIQKILTGLSD
ncbi:phage head morphogenesis protein [Parasphaerochaeta coccoides]|uniref:Phage head morphogenesis protein, SPP1 gp7 family n=1 Tax=Parasphaerochaeta coccoides (strain ATCC BAA-1237 / DSM 17374 / SPN1) TaxID=760011 RepID=F4GHE1_PARC1|nr:minor capsid protein [Parasphaerochaeta coccoides]AEC02040.1 phage head morphogenesis protein, SPP1 gp7 family [Parasphaerochaeta coccoides DSM 17374]